MLMSSLGQSVSRLHIRGLSSRNNHDVLWSSWCYSLSLTASRFPNSHQHKLCSLWEQQRKNFCAPSRIEPAIPVFYRPLSRHMAFSSRQTSACAAIFWNEMRFCIYHKIFWTPFCYVIGLLWFSIFFLISTWLMWCSRHNLHVGLAVFVTVHFQCQ